MSRSLARHRLLVAVAIGTAIALGLAACSAGTPSPGTSIRVGMYPTTDMLPVYVMESAGIAERHGFAIVESEPYGGGLAASEGLIRNEIDITYPGIVPLLALAAEGAIPADIAVVGVNTVATPEAPSAALLANAEIASWGDLSGRQIGIHNVTSINAASFAARALLEGVRDTTFVIVEFRDMGLAVRDGLVAAAVMEEPWTTQSLMRGDGHILGFTQGEPPMASVPQTAIAVRAELLDDPDLLRRFLAAHLEAVAFIAAHEPEARRALIPKQHVSEEVAEALRLKAFPLDARLDLASLSDLERTMADAGLLSTLVDPATFYDPTTLESVLAGGG